MRSLRVILILVLLSLAAASCHRTPTMQKIQLQGEAQGTYFSITYYDEQGRNFRQQVDSVLGAIDNSLSLWVDNSLISRINEGDSTAIPDDHFIYNFLLAKEVSAATDGYFDFTIGPLVQAWGFHRKNRLEMTPQMVDSLKALVDYRRVHIERRRVVKDDPRISFDFNAIAQGYTVDLIAELFDNIGLKHFIIDVGGEIVARNRKPDGTSWRVGIETPAESKDDERKIEKVIPLENMGLSTSGNYRKYFEQDGKRFSHSIDPKTGYPVQHNLMSVTVLAENAAMADAYSTAFMVMGMDKALEIIPYLGGIEAFFIYYEDGKYKTKATPGMESLFEK
ncbi:MAG TPA: FAD:protein FMN transferase [Bacteroidales bacterium]|nr:FAD:protein FMN transferase [Bacteroidales bacterium]